jgi:hypothetical protein
MFRRARLQAMFGQVPLSFVKWNLLIAVAAAKAAGAFSTVRTSAKILSDRNLPPSN